MATPPKNAADLTQAEVYALYAERGGYLTAKQESQLNHLLEEMGDEDQTVAEIRSEIGDRLYWPVVRALEAMQAKDAPRAPRDPAPRQDRAGRVREAVIERRQAREAWGKMVKEATR